MRLRQAEERQAQRRAGMKNLRSYEEKSSGVVWPHGSWQGELWLKRLIGSKMCFQAQGAHEELCRAVKWGGDSWGSQFGIDMSA